MKKSSDLYQRTMAIFLILYIAFMAILNILLPDRVFSETENRRLEQTPRLSFEKLFKGKFTSDYEKYISDQFPFRDFFIGVKSDCERLTGKKENNNVYLGKDGYLLEKFEKPNIRDMENKVQAINSFANSIPDINMYFMLVPNSVKILEDKLPEFAPVEDEFIYIDKVKNSLSKDIKFVDVRDTLSSKKNEYIYYKTDHHWTTKGAFYAYENLCKYMNLTPHGEEYFQMEKATDDFYGSLYSKGGFRHLSPDSIYLYMPKKDEDCRVEYCEEEKVLNTLYNENSLKNKDKYTVFLGGNYPLIKIKTDISGGKKLLVIKDSYANSFVPFLTGHFSEIYMVDLRYFDDNLKDLIKDNDIDDVLILYNVKSFFEDSSIEKISY